MKSLKSTYRLNNGYEIPCVGFGTYKSTGREAYDSVLEALRVGYRHIDTAAFYDNESDVGAAIRDSGLERSEIFVTSKVWNSDQGTERTIHAFERTMENLGLDYLDLYLIHWPQVSEHEEEWKRLNRETWQAMERLYEDSRIKAIGVSNFKAHHIISLMETSLTLPMVNQIELHPGLSQPETVDFCQELGIIVEAWSPFSRGALFTSGVLDQIAAYHGKSISQVCLRWHLQRGIVPLPKSATPSRIAENTEIFDFKLSEQEMEYINGLDGMAELGRTGKDPDQTAVL